MCLLNAAIRILFLIYLDCLLLVEAKSWQETWEQFNDSSPFSIWRKVFCDPVPVNAKKKKRYYCDCCTCRVGLHLLQSHTTCKLQPVLRCFCCSHFIPAAQERHAHAAMGNFIDAHIRSYRIHALKYACVYFQLTGSELECEDSLIFFSGR